MPYIKPELRPLLDEHISNLASRINQIAPGETDVAGLLNYSCTKLAIRGALAGG